MAGRNPMAGLGVPDAMRQSIAGQARFTEGADTGAPFHLFRTPKMKPLTFVLIHGAWHTGEDLADVAQALRREGHVVHTPTLLGNGAGDSRQVTLSQVIDHLAAWFRANAITDAILYSHSYGGMVATGTYDRLPEGTVRRLIYHCSFVPNDGESLIDLCPPAFQSFWHEARQPDGGVMLPYIVWREALMNDADEDLARRTHARMGAHPFNTVAEKIRLSRNPAAFPCGKSYIKSQWDWGQPPSLLGYYRFVERLGLYRHIEMGGGHEVCLTDPEGLARHIYLAGRD